MNRTKVIALALSLVALVATMAGCAGQGANNDAANDAANYPEKPINMIVAFTAGGSSDVQARIMQKYWDKYADQRWVFVYKPGAGGAIGFAEIAKSKADGYTIGGVNVPHIILQPLGQGAQFSPEDFEYIAQVVNDPQVLVVKKGSQFKSAQEVVDYAKANPGKLKVGITGTFTGNHLALLKFQDKADIEVAQIVYKGAADQNAALLGGEIDVMMGNYNDVMRSLDQMTVLAIASEERAEKLPDVPTFKEVGFDMVSEIRRGFVAPKGIDEAKLQYLRDIFKKIADDPDYQKDMETAGQPSSFLDGEAFGKYVMEENKDAENILKSFNLI